MVCDTGTLNNAFKAKKKESPVVGQVADILLENVSISQT